MKYFMRLRTDRKLEITKKNFDSMSRLLNNDAGRGITLEDGMVIRMSAVDCVWPELTEEELKAKKTAELKAKEDLLDLRKKEAAELKVKAAAAKKPIQKPATPKL